MVPLATLFIPPKPTRLWTMSTPAKGSVLRLVIPRDASGKILSSLGPSAKLESRDIVLAAGRLTTGEIVGHIKEYTRTRDELLHSMRTLGLPRQTRGGLKDAPSFASLLSEAREQLEKDRTRYQELQTRIELVEKQIEEAKKQTGRINEMVEAGFASPDVATGSGEFRGVIGRIPLRRLEAARSAIESVLKDQTVLATGNRKKEGVYILLATSPAKLSQALQTLILYDFVQTEVPSTEEPDLRKTLASIRERCERDTRELEASKKDLKEFRDTAGEALNRLADMVQDALMLLRAILKIGEGSNVAQVHAWLDKTPPARMMNMLSELGVLYETE